MISLAQFANLQLKVSFIQGVGDVQSCIEFYNLEGEPGRSRLLQQFDQFVAFAK
jgi:hypothetical protein